MHGENQRASAACTGDMFDVSREWQREDEKRRRAHWWDAKLWLYIAFVASTLLSAPRSSLELFSKRFI